MRLQRPRGDARACRRRLPRGDDAWPIAANRRLRTEPSAHRGARGHHTALRRVPLPAERVLCVRREEIFPAGPWHGFVDDGLEDAQRLFRDRSIFMPRRDVEEDPGYQQIIPYLVFRHRDRYFLTKRLKASSEKRLRHLYSLGVGGHINPEDVADGDPLTSGMRREWEEEVVYRGSFEARLLGLIEGDDDDIAIRETDKLSGELLALDEMRIYYLEMESWSQIVYDRLVSERKGG